MHLDKIDLRILRELQANGRMTTLALSARINLSATACQRRIRQLEDRGVIDRYSAVINPAILGLKIQAFVRVNIERQSRELTERFENAIRKLPEVRACYVMTGELDFLLHVFVADLEAFAEFSMRKLIDLPGVKDVRSSLVLESVKLDEGLALSAVRLS